MTVVQKFEMDGKELYRVSEPSIYGYHVMYCTLEEVLRLLSTPERVD